MIGRQRNEHTIAERVRVRGRGYWSGRGVNVHFVPASVGTGIRFVRTDLPGRPEIAVDLSTRTDQSLRTNLAIGEAKVEMIEHAMAALYALEIDNCIVELDGEELPGLDGSSAAYVDALRSAGMVMQASARRQLIIDRTVRIGTAASWIEASPSIDGRMHVEYRLDYGPDSPIRPQTFSSPVSPETFARDFAPARTFVTADQAESLRRAGVASHVTNRDLLVFDHRGPIGNLLRYPNECARHKALDLIGDLALVGAELVGKIISHRGGHQLNGSMAEQLCKIADFIPMGCRRAA